MCVYVVDSESEREDRQTKAFRAAEDKKIFMGEIVKGKPDSFWHNILGSKLSFLRISSQIHSYIHR